METLRLTSFGVRGFVGESLTPDIVIDYASAFGTFVQGQRVLLGRDTRYSSPMLRSAAVSGLMSAGCEILDMGICPTPVLQFCIKAQGAAGGISISGGHNAMGWNALTLIGSDGAYLEPVGGEQVLDTFHARDFLKQDWTGMGEVRAFDDYRDAYFQALEDQLDVAAIRRADLTVLIDPVGGSGCALLEPFARRLGITLVPINATPSGYLGREAEPRPRSGLQMASIIEHLKGDVGFILSSDMSRMSIVTEEGEPASEESTFAIIANHVLGKTQGTVVTNCCTTRTIDDIAELKKVPLVKTHVGQAFVVSTLADEQGLIGGEGSGSVVLPAFSPAFDGFLMMGLVLEAIAQSQGSVSELLKALPRYHMEKKNIFCDSRDGYRALEIVRTQVGREDGGCINLMDGLRVDWDDGWIHVRPSRTQQMVRVISEASTRAAARRRAEEIVRIIEHEV